MDVIKGQKHEEIYRHQIRHLHHTEWLNHTFEDISAHVDLRHFLQTLKKFQFPLISKKNHSHC